MQLTDFVADVPEDVWAVFEPILPPVVWQGVGHEVGQFHRWGLQGGPSCT